VQVMSSEGSAVVIPSDGSSPVVVSGPVAPSSGPSGSDATGGKPGDDKDKPGEKKDESDKSKEDADKDKSKEGKEGEKEKPPEPIARPSEPPKPPDPEELKVRPDADGKIRFNFNGQPWQGVLQWLADVSGMSLDWQELPGDYLNLTTQRGYTLDEVRFSGGLRDRMRRIDIDTVTFDTGSWEVTADQGAKLEMVAKAILRAIQSNPAEVFLIEGHTDAVGSDVDNLSLSDRRAEAIAVVLTEQFGVPAENLTTQGYGEQYLKVPTDGPERQNRRVTVRRITPLLTGQNVPPR